MNNQQPRVAGAGARAPAPAGSVLIRLAAVTLVTSLVGLSACSALKPTPLAPPVRYTLDGLNTDVPAAPLARPSAPTAPTLLISPPQAAAGLDSPHILYARQAHRLAYFAHSEWADTPARMLAPRLVAALDRAGVFRAVVSPPTAVKADLRLDTEVVRLQHNFDTTPSQVRLTLRATLSDNTTRQVLAQIELDHRADAASEDAHGGVVAANRATQQMLNALAVFCGQAVETWRTGPTSTATAAKPAAAVRTAR